MEIKRGLALIGILLFFWMAISGCGKGPAETELTEGEPAAAELPVQTGPTNQEPQTSIVITDPQEIETARLSPTESMVVYFDQFHGDHGIGVLIDPDANTEDLVINKDTEGIQEWGWRTGNGKALTAPDGNSVEDVYIRFDLQSHILFKNPEGAIIQIEIEYLDEGTDEFNLEYDAYSSGADGGSEIKSTEKIKKTNSGEIRTVLIILKDALFVSSINDHADFQINDLMDGPETIRRIIVRVPGEREIAEDSGGGEEAAEEPAASNPVEGWAVLAEKDDFSDVGMSNMLVDYIDIDLLQTALADLGWESDHIHELREFDRDSLQAELDWLEEMADENDVVFLFVTSHSGFLAKVVLWQDFFPEEWSQIKSERRLLVVDSCLAGRYTEMIGDDPKPNLSIAAGDTDELLWKALKDEGLPFIGAVFNHYFSDALTNPVADQNGDGLISVQEAALWAEEQQRVFMHEILFAVPEYLQGFHDLGVTPELDPTFPDVIFHDTIGEPLYLDLDAYQP